MLLLARYARSAAKRKYNYSWTVSIEYCVFSHQVTFVFSFFMRMYWKGEMLFTYLTG